MIPLWLLDVDGVINATRPGWGAAPLRRTVLCAGREWRIRWAPMLTKRIRHLVMTGAVEIQWCSTWCGDTRHLEQALGLPQLESAFVVPQGEYVGDLKVQAARDVHATGRRLIWTDDAEVPLCGPLHDRLVSDGRALLIRPDERRGLTPHDMELIEGFCTEVPGGQ